MADYSFLNPNELRPGMIGYAHRHVEKDERHLLGGREVFLGLVVRWIEGPKNLLVVLDDAKLPLVDMEIDRFFHFEGARIIAIPTVATINFGESHKSDAILIDDKGELFIQVTTEKDLTGYANLNTWCAAARGQPTIVGSVSGWRVSRQGETYLAAPPEEVIFSPKQAA